MNVKRLQNAYLVVGDMDRADAFYRIVLGAQPKFRDADRWSQYSLGGANFSLSSTGEAPEGFTGCMLVFEVDDLDAVRAQAIAAGGRIEGERDMSSHGRVLTLRDPEGNLLQLFAKAADPAAGH